MPAHTTIDVGPKPLRWLRDHHPSVDLKYLEDIRALYAGGKFLLRNPDVFPRLFPKMAGETDESYNERKNRAFYVNHFATVIDFMVAGLAQDPARIVPKDGDADAQVVDEFLREFEADTSPPGGEVLPFAQLLADQARNGLLYQRWWTLVDLPNMGPDYAPTSLLDQERDGALDAWAVVLDPLSVLDWQQTSSGELLWVKISTRERVRSSPTSPRDTTRFEFRVYTTTDWALYVVEQRDGQSPTDDKVDIPPTASGEHSFGRCPVIPACLAVGLWAGNKLHSLAVEYLNQRCGLSWAEMRSLFQQLYEFLDSTYPGIGEPIKDGAAADPHRAVRQPRGPGKIQTRGAQDKAEFIGPDPGPFSHSLASLEALRDDMFRVTYQMALAADTSGATIRRSAESKGKDGEAASVVLTALGGPLRSHGDDVIALVRKARAGAEHVTAGFESFNADDLDAAINQAVMLDGLSLPSATAKKLLAERLIRQVLGADATPEVMASVKEELDEAITQDQLTAPTPPVILPPAEVPPAEGDPPPPGEHPAPEPPPPPKKARRAPAK